MSGIPEGVAARERDLLLEATGWPPDTVATERVASPGHGNAVLLEAECDGATEVFAGFGAFGVRAESVADGVVQDYRRWLAAGVPVGRHLADQLLLPMALARGGSFRTMPLSSHAATNIASLREFGLGVETREEGRATVVSVAAA